MANAGMVARLRGARTTAGVVRIGDAVRWPRSGNADFIADLLRQAGVDAAPHWPGVDEQGRDTLGFIAGEVPTEPGNHSDAVLQRAARVSRRCHDATSDMASALRAEVVCHNHLSPCNFVFREGRPVAIIELDAAATGTRANDMGYAARRRLSEEGQAGGNAALANWARDSLAWTLRHLAQ